MHKSKNRDQELELNPLHHDDLEMIPDFNFQYDNANPRRRCEILHPRIPCELMKSRKIVSGKLDLALSSNLIRTNKYNSINFIPKNLLEQFSKIANIYFLFIGIMQSIRVVSNTEGIPTICVPLGFIVILSMIKDFFEDYKRKSSDAAENKKVTYVFEKEQQKLVKKEWYELRVGDVIRLEQNEYTPADILVLSTSEPKGVCYIETKNLDGETNLKIKSAPKEISKIYDNLTQGEWTENIIFEYERPNPFLYTFTGSATTIKGKKISIDNNNFILRGSSLRNTKFLYGLVAFTGHDTKIMLNSFKARSKKSKLERIMGVQIIIIFLVQVKKVFNFVKELNKVLLCFFCAIYYVSWYQSDKNYVPYLSIDLNGNVENSLVYNLFVRYGNWTLVFSNFVPISLLVTLESVKLAQGVKITNDSELLQKSTNIPATVNSSNLNEELGQIEYIFSDKTGTLTCNIMDFKKISIAGISYGEIQDPNHQNYIKDISNFPKVTNVDFRDGNLFDIINNESHPQHQNIRKCLIFLSICHTAIAEKKDDDIVYNASSPDELALINFAKFCGMKFLGVNDNNEILIEFQNQIHVFRMVYSFEFNSDRKRQSIIIEDDQGDVILYCKGADSIIEKRLKPDVDMKIKEETWQNLEDYGRIGLRTLVLGEKRIEKIFFSEWKKKYQEAITSIIDREAKMSVLQDELERDLDLVGATAIEDKLQDEVEDTIRSLRDAGIKVWVLTGDKIETAINIGFSCGLLENDMVKFIVEEVEYEKVNRRFDEILIEIKGTEEDNLALIIHGDSLLHTAPSEDPKHQQLAVKLLRICQQCEVVLCCRVSPKQKQEIVSMVRNNVDALTSFIKIYNYFSFFRKNSDLCTLAIGDGANDVNMITAAHVGVGIRGVEGQQAARAGDYAIAEFKFLRRLLFYHGRESYRRNSYLVCYNFFKNICLVLPQFWYGFLNNFAGVTLYDSYVYQLFNVFYASLPIIIYAVSDKEHDPSVLVENKINYYEQGIHSRLFNSKVFWSWFFLGTWHSIILVYVPYLVLEYNFVERNGLMESFWASGMMVFGMCVVVANMKIIIISNTHNFISLFVIVMSMVLFLLSLLILAQVSTVEFYKMSADLLSNSYFHLGNLLILVSTSLIDFAHEIYLKFLIREESFARSEIIKKSIAFSNIHLQNFKEEGMFASDNQNPNDNQIPSSQKDNKDKDKDKDISQNDISIFPLNPLSNRPLIKEENESKINISSNNPIEESSYKTSPYNKLAVFRKTKTKYNENKLTIVEKLSNFDLDSQFESNLQNFLNIESKMVKDDHDHSKKSVNNLGFAFSFEDKKEENKLAGRFKK